MLKPLNRLRKKLEVLGTLKKGKRFKGRFVTLVFKERPRSKVPRFAFSISSKIDKRATVRNRIKRWARADISQLLNRIIPGYDTVVIIRNCPKSHLELLSDIEDSLQNIKLLK